MREILFKKRERNILLLSSTFIFYSYLLIFSFHSIYNYHSHTKTYTQSNFLFFLQNEIKYSKRKLVLFVNVIFLLIFSLFLFLQPPSPHTQHTQKDTIYIFFQVTIPIFFFLILSTKFSNTDT